MVHRYEGKSISSPAGNKGGPPNFTKKKKAMKVEDALSSGLFSEYTVEG